MNLKIDVRRFCTSFSWFFRPRALQTSHIPEESQGAGNLAPGLTLPNSTSAIPRPVASPGSYLEGGLKRSAPARKTAKKASTSPSQGVTMAPPRLQDLKRGQPRPIGCRTLYRTQARIQARIPMKSRQGDTPRLGSKSLRWWASSTGGPVRSPRDVAFRETLGG